MAKDINLKFGNPVGIKTICEFTLNWYLRAALAKNSGILCVNSAMIKHLKTSRRPACPGQSQQLPQVAQLHGAQDRGVSGRPAPAAAAEALRDADAASHSGFAGGHRGHCGFDACAL